MTGPSLTGFALALPPSARSEVSDSFWRSLFYFNYYRLSVAALFLLVVLFYRDELNLGSHNLSLFVYTSAAYVCAAFVFHAVLRKWRSWFHGQLTVHVLTDIAALVLMMNASSGMRSGLGVMLLISLAGAALVSRGTLMLFYAAVASIGVLLEQAYWVLIEDHPTANFLQPGLLSIGYFATALITNQLAQRVIMNERVARQRGADLANQLRINQLVIQDVQDGVMVVDPNGLVRLHNPQVPLLLGHSAPELDQIERYSSELARHLAAWRAGSGPASVSVRFPDSGKLVRLRFVAAGVSGASFALIFLEDLSRQQEQAQQLKLAALGRLTANIAHEIRNPLSAITHASDLLREEECADGSDRLVQIILENARRLDRMVTDVLELSRRDRIEPQQIALSAHLSAFLDEFAGNEDVPRDRFAIESTPDVRVEFDRAHLDQVLWNLLRNAWRHCRKDPRSVRISVSSRRNRVELHVLDDGEGVPRELQSQLFEPFFTTFSSGTGLGLYIARELCAANGASLDYVERGEGADFRIIWQVAR
jgi:two-component system, NtrC family, sensor histidine kinase PilS